jgi:hypothetical protein
MDEGCSYPIQQGAKLSRARVYTFKHNDADDLAALLDRIEGGERRDRWVGRVVWVWVQVMVLGSMAAAAASCHPAGLACGGVGPGPSHNTMLLLSNDQPLDDNQENPGAQDDCGGGSVQQHGRGGAAQVSQLTLGLAFGRVLCTLTHQPLTANPQPPQPPPATQPTPTHPTNPLLIPQGASTSSRSATSTGSASRRRSASGCWGSAAAAPARRRGSGRGRCVQSSLRFMAACACKVLRTATATTRIVHQPYSNPHIPPKTKQTTK